MPDCDDTHNLRHIPHIPAASRSPLRGHALALSPGGILDQYAQMAAQDPLSIPTIPVCDSGQRRPTHYVKGVLWFLSQQAEEAYEDGGG